MHRFSHFKESRAACSRWLIYTGRIAGCTSVVSQQLLFSPARNGQFGKASEVIRVGLRLLQHEQAVQKLKIQRLREAAEPGIDDVAAGRFADFSATDISSHLEKVSALRKAPMDRTKRGVHTSEDLRKFGRNYFGGLEGGAGH